jgi:Fe-S-cluster containining protein
MTESEPRPVFKCQQCGDCCRGKGGIFVQAEEVEQLSTFLGMPREDFCRRYVEVSPMGAHLATKNGTCVFLKGNCCQVHPVKPRICRQWPFLAAILKHPEELAHAKTACPGITPDCSHEDFVGAAQRMAVR